MSVLRARPEESGGTLLGAELLGVLRRRHLNGKAVCVLECGNLAHLAYVRALVDADVPGATYLLKMLSAHGAIRLEISDD